MLFGGGMMPPYKMRQAMFGLSDQDFVKKLLLEKQQQQKKEKDDDSKSGGSDSDVVFLDVRNPDEIAEVSLLDEGIPFIEARYLLDSTMSVSRQEQQLQNDLEQQQQQQPKQLVVFCAKGGRAMKAIETLKQMGYTSESGYDVYNAGGINDVLDLLR